MRSSLSVCILCDIDQFEQVLLPYLEELSSEAASYSYSQFDALEKLLEYIQQGGHVDCLILQSSAQLQDDFDRLRQQTFFFPTVIVELRSQDSKELLLEQPTEQQTEDDSATFSYHPALVQLAVSHLNQIGLAIDRAIAKFIQLQPEDYSTFEVPASGFSSQQLMVEQVRLAEKLKARLDYLGVYYKRNPQNFLRYMTSSQKDELLRQLKQDYRGIILSYFHNQPNLNEMIDNFVNAAFFADLPTSQVVEIHMELMDEFSKQLKLEGRSDEVLLDYRLTLIDTLAHLCEMYRRSIPRKS